MADPVVLASTCKLPQAVVRDDHHSVEQAERVLRSTHIANVSNAQVAPYQALPVAGPVITTHKSPSLPVLDHDTEMTEEVCETF